MLLNDEGSDKWWPAPKKSYGPRWWERPTLPSEMPKPPPPRPRPTPQPRPQPQPVLVRFAPPGTHQIVMPSVTMANLGALRRWNQTKQCLQDERACS